MNDGDNSNDDKIIVAEVGEDPIDDGNAVGLGYLAEFQV
jgi:hypothetical protein